MDKKRGENIEAIINWVKKNRPDCLDSVEGFLALEDTGDDKGRAMVFLMAIGFQAGREYQHEHPTLGPRDFATDGPMIVNKPPTKKRRAA